MAKPNYAFEKRQKELAKKQKKQEKLQQRQVAGGHETADEATPQVSQDDATLVPAPSAD